MTEPSAPSKSDTRRGVIVGVAIALAVLIGLVALVVWAFTTSRSAKPRPVVDRHQQYRTAWTSAMAKAGVETTFPPAPVALDELVVTGNRPFEATFTAEEIGALMSVYPYEAELQGQTVSLTDVAVAFPEPGVGTLAGELVTADGKYSARATAPLEYTPTGIDSTGLTELKVEGFSVGGERRAQAGEAIVAYLNLYLNAAPGLTIETASITEDGLVVSGSAPVRLEHPAPAD